jgi:hypothetical protein
VFVTLRRRTVLIPARACSRGYELSASIPVTSTELLVGTQVPRRVLMRTRDRARTTPPAERRPAESERATRRISRHAEARIGGAVSGSTASERYRCRADGAPRPDLMTVGIDGWAYAGLEDARMTHIRRLGLRRQDRLAAVHVPPGTASCGDTPVLRPGLTSPTVWGGRRIRGVTPPDSAVV